MDSKRPISDHADMPGKAKPLFRALYVGEWITLMKKTREEICEGASIEKAYLAQLISGEKKNPSAKVVLGISEVLGVTVNDLYKKPPNTFVTIDARFAGFSPGVINLTSCSAQDAGRVRRVIYALFLCALAAGHIDRSSCQMLQPSGSARECQVTIENQTRGVDLRQADTKLVCMSRARPGWRHPALQPPFPAKPLHAQLQ